MEQIRGFSGVLKSGEMALVVGRPGSGCTTFLKTLANFRDSFAGIDGDVLYGNMGAKEAKKVRLLAIYPSIFACSMNHLTRADDGFLALTLNTVPWPNRLQR